MKLLVYLRFGLYRGTWRYAGRRDNRRLAEATINGLLPAAAMLFLVHRWESFSRGVILLDAVFSILFLIVLRLSVRFYHFRKYLTKAGVPRNVRQSGRQSGSPAGSQPTLLFASPNIDPAILADLGPENQGVVLNTEVCNEPTFHNLPVLGTRDELAVALDACKVREVYVALAAEKEPSLDPVRAQTLSLIRGLCQERDIPWRMLTGLAAGLDAGK